MGLLKMKFLNFYAVVRLVLILMLANSYILFGQQSINIGKQSWIHGSDPCSQNTDPGLQVVQYDRTTFIIRQNKCVHYEAPFLYLLIGTDKALLMDTGAEAAESSFPLYETVNKILSNLKGADGKALPLTVIHSHSHDDHYGGDHQFLNKPRVRIISPTKDSLINFFDLKHWPETEVSFDLGHRELIIIPIPGHDESSIAIYDSQTKWLLTGDTIYPGRLYVRNWESFQSSISRLYSFSKEHEVSYLMGNHIEMTTAHGVDYPTGTTYQPHEHALALEPTVLKELHHACEKMGDHLVYQIHRDFILVPK